MESFTPALGLLALGMLVWLAVRLAVPVYVVRSSSMEPTLRPGDRVLVTRVLRHTSLRRGHIVVLSMPYDAAARGRTGVAASRLGREGHFLTRRFRRRELIKRIVALEGDIVRAIGSRGIRDTQDLLVPAGGVFVLGDNQAVSQDSRSFGPIDRKDLLGRAVLIVWPPTRFRFITGGLK